MTGGEGELHSCEGYRELLDHAADMIFLVDDGARVVYANAAVTRTLGLDPDSLVDESLVSYVHDADRADLESVLTRSLDASPSTGDGAESDDTDPSDTKPDTNETDSDDTDTAVEGLKAAVRVETADDDWRWIEFACGPRTPDSLGGVVVTARDVTAQRRVTERFKHLVETASDLLVVLDGNGVLKYATPAAGRVLGYEYGELLGENVLQYIHPDDRERVVAELSRGVEEPGYTATVEHRFRSRNGEWRWLESRGRSLPDAPALEGRIVVVTRDITARRGREQQIAEQNERLDAFAGMVSHDLQNPLSVASGSLELYRQTGNEDALDRADRALQRMSELTSELLTLAREGSAIENPTSVSLVDCATAALETSPLSPTQATIDEDLPVVLGNDIRIRSLFENLFRNVAEHAGPDPHVWVEPLADGNGFAVEDDGSGIPDAAEVSVFELGESNDGGMGIGLHVVETIASAHGWDVSVTTGREGGARFEIRGVESPPEQ